MYIIGRNRLYNTRKYHDYKAASKEKEEAQNIKNQKILDSILDDDESNFSELISEMITHPTDANGTFSLTNYKIPDFLADKPPYASVCACFGSEKCFNSISMLLPAGTFSEEMKKVDGCNRSAIHFACIGGNLSIIRELEQAGFDINCKDSNGYLPSHYAAMFGNIDVIRYLWTKGGDILSYSNETFFQHSMRPIEVACLYGNLEIVKFICETVLTKKLQVSDFFSANKFSTPMHFACIGGHDNIVKYFLQNPEYSKWQINALDQNSRNPLLCACHNGSLNCIKAILNHGNGKINLSRKGRKHLPLVDAAEGGFLDIVQFLLNQKGVNIKQQTSQGISAIDAAVDNDHLDIVKFLINNGAAIDFDSDKIGDLLYCAFETGNIDMIRFLDKKLDVPYLKESQLFETNFQLKRIKIDKMTFGDKYMQKACFQENKDMVNFLLQKKCNLNTIDPSMIIRGKAFDFLDFLIEKGLDITKSNPCIISPPIVTMIRYGDYEQVKNFVSKGAEINKEIISQYNIIQSVSTKGDLKLFKYILSFEPEISEPDYIYSLKNAMIKYYSIDKTDENAVNDCVSVIELILENSNIDLNNAMCNQYESFITFAINRKCMKLLEVFEKHGVNYEDCALNFEQMTEEDDIRVLNYLKEHGCKFKRVLNRKSSTTKTSKSPLKVMLSRFLTLRNLCIDTLLFILDYSTPKNIINTKLGNNNVIDVFINYNSVDGILKAYKITDIVIYPLSLSKSEYEQWVKNTNNAELIDLVI